MTVFADTFYYLALLSPTDEAHPKALSYTRGFDGRMVTTDWVLMELADGLCSRGARLRAAAFLQSQLSDPAVTVVPSERGLFEEGLKLYSERPDKEWSLTDCISFVVMQHKQISDALTGDHHFEQAGFRILLK